MGQSSRKAYFKNTKWLVTLGACGEMNLRNSNSSQEKNALHSAAKVTKPGVLEKYLLLGQFGLTNCYFPMQKTLPIFMST